MLAPAVATRAASVVRSIGDALPGNEAARAFEHLVSSTLEAQGHRGLPADDPTRLPEVYDPAFIHADTDLAGVADGLARSRAGRLCLYGAPGTGKTAYGRWLAQQIDAPLVVRRGSDLMSKWVGKTEKNIAAAFAEAEDTGAVLLIDEVDGFLQDRRRAERAWEVAMVNEMLTRMESFGGIFVASTNLMDGLDAASLRRFDLKVRFGYLQPDQAARLLDRCCATQGLPAPDAAATDALRRLSTLTPGDFSAVLRQNRFRPMASGSALVEALAAECALKAGPRASIGFLA